MVMQLHSKVTMPLDIQLYSNENSMILKFVYKYNISLNPLDEAYDFHQGLLNCASFVFVYCTSRKEIVVIGNYINLN